MLYDAKSDFRRVKQFLGTSPLEKAWLLQLSPHTEHSKRGKSGESISAITYCSHSTRRGNVNSLRKERSVSLFHVICRFYFFLSPFFFLSAANIIGKVAQEARTAGA